MSTDGIIPCKIAFTGKLWGWGGKILALYWKTTVTKQNLSLFRSAHLDEVW